MGKPSAVLDLLPEQESYADDGCTWRGVVISAHCLDCLLPECKHNDPGMLYRRSLDELHGRIVEAVKSERLTSLQAAERFGVSQRMVFRVLAAHRSRA